MLNLVKDFNFWIATGTWLGLAVAIAGFYFVIRQLKADRQTLETQTSWQIYNVGAAVLRTFINHPECRPYFYENQPLPRDEPLRSTVLAINELVCDHLENIVLHHDALDTETFSVWQIYMQGLYNRSPTMREFLRNDREGYRYSAEMLAILRRGAGEQVGSQDWINLRHAPAQPPSDGA